MNNEEIVTLKNPIKFQRSPAKMGETSAGKTRYVFNIPQVYIDNNLIDPNGDYTIYVVKS